MRETYGVVENKTKIYIISKQPNAAEQSRNSLVIWRSSSACTRCRVFSKRSLSLTPLTSPTHTLRCACAGILRTGFCRREEARSQLLLVQCCYDQPKRWRFDLDCTRAPIVAYPSAKRTLLPWCKYYPRPRFLVYIAAANLFALYGGIRTFYPAMCDWLQFTLREDPNFLTMESNSCYHHLCAYRDLDKGLHWAGVWDNFNLT